MEMVVSVHEDQALVQAVKELAVEGYRGPGKPEFASRDKFVWLRETTSKLWLDTGDKSAAEGVWSAEFDALTTNNTLVNQVVQTGAMDGVIAYGARKIREVRPDIGRQDLVIELAFLANVRLALELVGRFGAMVSVELHPDLANDVKTTRAFARRYYDIDPEHFYIKVPYTPDGLIAVRQLTEEGIPVNLTLGFSARQNYLAAKFARPRFVNVFLGRLNQLVEENHLGRPENVGEKAALASNEMIADMRASDSNIWTEQIGASLRSGEQMVILAGMDVLTIPPKVAQEYLEMDVSREDIVVHNWRDLNVEIDSRRIVEADSFITLWEIGKEFIAFVEDATKQAGRIQTGSDLVEFSRRRHVALFHDWQDEDKNRIRQKGKIPDISEWPGVPVDDLMSISALMAFSKDQSELDSHIERLIFEGA